MQYLYDYFKYTIYKDYKNKSLDKLNELVDIEIQVQIDVIEDLLATDIDVVHESILLSDICYLENILGQDHYIKLRE